MLRRVRWKTALTVLGAAAFVAIGVFMVRGAMDESARRSPEMIHLMGWICIVFFGGTGLLGLWGLYRPAELRLTPEGFQVKGLRLGRVVQWREIQQFYITQVRSTKIVRYRLHSAPNDFQRAMGREPNGMWTDGSIPTHLELHPDKVAALLEDWRVRHAAA